MVVGIRVEAENIQTGKIKHCNSSYFTMVAKDEAGKNTAIPGLILDSPESVRRFARSIKRQEDGRQRSSRFEDKEFIMEEHLHLLEGRNAKLNLG